MPGPGLEAHEPERLGRGRVDDLPDVDRHAVGQHPELVDERDVDRAEDVLEQLRHLRDLEGGHRDELVADERVELLGAGAAGRREAADDLRRRAQRVVGAARVDALGREGDVEVAARAAGRSPRAAAARARAWCPGRSSTRARSAGRPAPRPTARAAADVSGPRSGSRFAVSGVGTQTMIASASASRETRVVGLEVRRDRAQAVARDVLDVGLAARGSARRGRRSSRRRSRAGRPRRTRRRAAARRIRARRSRRS